MTKKQKNLSRNDIRSLESQVFDTILPQLEAGVFLLGVSFLKEAGSWTLRVDVENTDAKNGKHKITLDECEAISRKIDPLLETLPALANLSYNLEVSSPGAFRTLSTVREFEFFTGSLVKIEKASVAPNLKKHQKPPVVEGILAGYDADKSILTVTLPGNPTGSLPPGNLSDRLPASPENTAVSPQEFNLADGGYTVTLNPTIHLDDTATNQKEINLS